MKYFEIPPSPPLSEFIRFFWILESHEAPSGDVMWERILPDGCAELIIHYRDKFQLFNGTTSIVQDRCFIFGQIDRFIEVAPTGNTGIIAIRFKPHGIRPFLSFSARELTANAYSLQTLFGNKGRELQDQLLNAGGNRERIHLLELFLLKQLAANRPEDKLIVACIDQIRKLNGNLQVRDLTEKYGISERHLERRFADVVGLSPKLFARITRFRHIFDLLENRPINSLTALAYESGYYDQAHFIREFKAFSGQNPRQYLNTEHPLGDHFNGS